MRKLKKTLALLVCLVMMLSLAACGSSQTESTAPAEAASSEAAPAAEKVQLTFWAGLTGDDLNAMQGMVDEFNASQDGIEVTFYSVSWSEIFSKLEASYDTDVCADVMLMHVTDIPNYGARGMLSDMSELAAACGITEADYPASVWAGAFYDGVQYAIPWDYHHFCLYVNNEMFTAAGLDPTAAFEDEAAFLSACEALKTAGYSAIGVGAADAHTYRAWYGLLYQLGGSFCDDAFTTAEFASPEGEQALAWLRSLVDKGYAPEHEDDAQSDWLSGKVAIRFDGPWFTPTAVKSDIDFSVIPFVKLSDTGAVWGSSHTLTVPNRTNRSAEKTEAINTFYSWMISHGYEWGAKSGQIPANYNVAASDEYKACDIYQYQKTFIDTAEWVHYEPLCTADSEFGADNALSPVLTAVTNIVSGNSTDIAAELQTAADSVNDIFAEYNS